MRWASASTRLDLPEAGAAELARELRSQLAGETPDLLLLFASGPGTKRTEDAAKALPTRAARGDVRRGERARHRDERTRSRTGRRD
jgi:hypothetical protein